MNWDVFGAIAEFGDGSDRHLRDVAMMRAGEPVVGIHGIGPGGSDLVLSFPIIVRDAPWAAWNEYGL